MKKVETIIMPFKIDDVKDALAKIGIRDMTVSEVRSPGGQTEYTEYYRGGRYEPAFTTKAKIEVEVAEEDLESVLAAIEKSAESAPYGGKKVLVYTLDDRKGFREKTRSVAAL